MTRAPIRVFRFLCGIDLACYSRERVCRATRLSAPTVNRALGKLVEIGAIERRRGGRSTPAKIRVLISLDDLLIRYVENDPLKPKTDPLSAEIDPLSARLRALEKSIEQEPSRPARKPPAVEIPPAVITDHLGQRIVNPAWQRVRDALAASDGPIRRARAPDRYRAAIVRRVVGEARTG